MGRAEASRARRVQNMGSLFMEGAPTHRVSRRLTRSPLGWRLPTGGSPRPRAPRRKGDRAWCTTFLERGEWQTTNCVDWIASSEVTRGEREGHLPIDHIALDFVISSESVRSGSGRSIVILLGQGKRFGDSIRLGRVEPRVKPRWRRGTGAKSLFLAFVAIIL